MKKLKQYSAFLLPYLIFVILLFGFIVFYEKGALHLHLNVFRSQCTDFFFQYYTQVGEWVPFVVAFGLLFYSYRAALLFAGAELGATLITRILKKLFYAPRPKVFFAENFPDIDLPCVIGVQLHSYKSFPSGHTAAAFALFFSLALLTKCKKLQFLYFILAVLVGYSRIYLSQHFAVDVLVGSLIGVGTTIISYWLIDKKSPQWYNKSLIKR